MKINQHIVTVAAPWHSHDVLAAHVIVHKPGVVSRFLKSINDTLYDLMVGKEWKQCWHHEARYTVKDFYTTPIKVS